MHEDKQETLEKMFPKGYVIVYIQQNDNPAIQWNNPLQDEFIMDLLTLLETSLMTDNIPDDPNEN